VFKCHLWITSEEEISIKNIKISECPFQDIKNEINISYTGEGRRIAREFYIPLLKRAQFYNRASGYFSIDSMVITAAGLAGLIKNEGKMRLVLGAHDFGPEITSRELNNYLDAMRPKKLKQDSELSGYA
jgi:hypothetical protein